MSGYGKQQLNAHSAAADFRSAFGLDISERYWLGYRHGKRTAEHGPSIDHEHRLKLELALMGTSNRAHRAFALGELRGYRQATNRPEPLYAHRVRT